jgi:hypothetical protein
MNSAPPKTSTYSTTAIMILDYNCKTLRRIKEIVLSKTHQNVSKQSLSQNKSL